MLIIRKIYDRDVQKRLCNECGIKYLDNAMAYHAIESDNPSEEYGKELALLQFTIGPGGAKFENITAFPGVSDPEAMILISRTAMEFLNAGCKIRYLRIEAGAAEEILIKTLGFKKRADQDVYDIDLDKFYQSPCDYLAENQNI